MPAAKKTSSHPYETNLEEVMGVVLGGRVGYCLFYKPLYYLAHPLEIFAVWSGGMSFHGGLLGVIVAMIWFARSRHKPWLQVADFVAPCVPTGLAAGRVGSGCASHAGTRLQSRWRGRSATGVAAQASTAGARLAAAPGERRAVGGVENPRSGGPVVLARAC